MFLLNSKRYHAFSILEFLVVILLSAIIAAGVFYLLRFTNQSFLSFENTMTLQNEQLRLYKILQNDFEKADLILSKSNSEIYFYGHYDTTTYVIGKDKFVRNGQNLMELFQMTSIERLADFEGHPIGFDDPIDFLKVSYTDRLEQEHSIASYKYYNKATLFNYFMDF